MMRKVVLTGLLLFTSERPMVRAVLATLTCCIMIVNLNYFQPHRNLIVFWVEQLANLSSTVKYLFAVVIAAGGGEEGTANSHVAPDDASLMGTLLIVSDVVVYGIAILAIIGCVLTTHQSLQQLRSQEKAEAKEVAEQDTRSQLSHALARRLSKTQIQPMAHRRASLRQEAPAERGLTAMMAHANDHIKTKQLVLDAPSKNGESSNDAELSLTAAANISAEISSWTTGENAIHIREDKLREKLRRSSIEEEEEEEDDGYVEIEVPTDEKAGSPFTVIVNGLTIHSVAPTHGKTIRINLKEEASHHMDL